MIMRYFMKNTTDVLPHIQNKYSLRCLYKYANLSHELCGLEEGINSPPMLKVIVL